MKRLKFDSDGKLFGVDGKVVGNSKPERHEKNKLELKTSDSLEFLKEEKKIENIFDREFWSLYENGNALKPMEFSNGKSLIPAEPSLIHLDIIYLISSMISEPIRSLLQHLMHIIIQMRILYTLMFSISHLLHQKAELEQVLMNIILSNSMQA